MLLFAVKRFYRIRNIKWKCQFVGEMKRTSGVARALPVGRVAHPKDQNEEKIKENIEEELEKLEENGGRLRKCSYLAHPRVRGCLRL